MPLLSILTRQSYQTGFENKAWHWLRQRVNVWAVWKMLLYAEKREWKFLRVSSVWGVLGVSIQTVKEANLWEMRIEFRDTQKHFFKRVHAETRAQKNIESQKVWYMQSSRRQRELPTLLWVFCLRVLLRNNRSANQFVSMLDLWLSSRQSTHWLSSSVFESKQASFASKETILSRRSETDSIRKKGIIWKVQVL